MGTRARTGIEGDGKSFFVKMVERAFMARSFIVLQSLYFILLSKFWSRDDPRSLVMFGVAFLHVAPAFLVAGLLGLAVVVMPRSKALVAIWLVAVGFVCLGRTFTVLGDPEFTSEEKWQNLGWVTQWLASLVSVVQIWAVGVLRMMLTQRRGTHGVVE